MQIHKIAGIIAVSACLGFSQSAAAPVSDTEAARFLDQATWGPTPDSIAEVEKSGISGWLQAQFALNVSDIPDQPMLDSAGKTLTDLRPVQAAFFKNAITGPDQLRQRVAFALSQIWVVSATAGVPNAYAWPPYWRIFRDNAFGNYRDLIRAVTLSPAMGRYLNMANNNKGNPSKGTAANENYARELMQLFTLGLTRMRTNGDALRDADGNPIPTYTQDTVTNMARALTGWTYPTAAGVTPRVNNPAYYLGPMIPVNDRHDTDAKTIVGDIDLPAGQSAEQDLESVLDALMRQDTMAPFVCRQLIQHLVTSNPSPQYLQRVSEVFLNNGAGVRGDLQAVVAAILTDAEARTTPGPDFGHLREPVLFLTGVLRGLGATLTDQSAIYSAASQMGENVFYAPSVFSYFSPQYRTANGLMGPEFQIYSTDTAARRANLVNTILYGSLDRATKVDLSPLTARAGDIGSLLDYISLVFLHHAMSDSLRAAATDAASAAGTAQAKAQATLYVTLTSGEYQVIR